MAFGVASVQSNNFPPPPTKGSGWMGASTHLHPLVPGVGGLMPLLAELSQKRLKAVLLQ